jgi:hypothetical protein
MSLIHNERVKLLATALNNTAVATVVTAVVAPDCSVSLRLDRGRKRMVAIDGFGLVFRWIEPTYNGAAHAWEAQGMTGLEIYILVVPVFLAGVGWAAYWWVVRYDRKHHRAD